MLEMDSKYGTVKIFADTIESEAIAQITKMANSPIGENAHIRIMPDVHAGKGCTVGTTMKITDKACPNIVGVDIGCGVMLGKFDMDFSQNLEKLDRAIHQGVPAGHNVRQNESTFFNFSELYCWDKLPKDTQSLAKRSMGTLGGGNHFIEAYEDGFISVHTGSRNIGLKIANYYQKLAEEHFVDSVFEDYKEKMKALPPQERQAFIEAYEKPVIEKDLMYLQGEDLEHYLHDVKIMQRFAHLNRAYILNAIADLLNVDFDKDFTFIDSVHNYIDTDSMILRKGSISAQQGEHLVIPLNMRDGLLLCTGKGNEDWNYSAPHGAGRLYSRSKAKEIFTVEEYANSMEGIYTTCVNRSTLDEAPFVYKDYQEIIKCIEPTVHIEQRLIPIYNFKAGE